MQHDNHITLVTNDAPIAVQTHGARAKCLQRLTRIGLPVPTTVALSFDAVERIAQGTFSDIDKVMAHFPDDAMLCVRPSSQSADWGGPATVLNIGINPSRIDRLSTAFGADVATALYGRFIQGYATHVERLDPDIFDAIDANSPEAVKRYLEIYQDALETPFPTSRSEQLVGILKSMARAWRAISAKLLRQAKGAPADAGLGLVIQTMAVGSGTDECGVGWMQLCSSQTGLSELSGNYYAKVMPNAIENRMPDRANLDALRDRKPELFEKLLQDAAQMREKLRAEMLVEFAIEDGELRILDSVRISRTARAALRIAVQLAEDGIISKDEALMRIEPPLVNELLHPQIDASAPREIVGHGIAASPGAATGRLVFSSAEAQASAARGEDCILARRETVPEDVRGMHAARGVITERGGMTSHAAVIGRGIGVPCVVGVSDFRISQRKQTIRIADGQTIRAGDIVTVDGSSGTIVLGAPKMQEAKLDDAFGAFMSWADERRDIEIRANADTPDDAQVALSFKAQGIGLCRTEHMFFDAGRLTPMREMIFAKTPEERRAVLDHLLPLQRDDFVRLFKIMRGFPVCIRLFDVPLHEFLPLDRHGQRELAEALNLPLSVVTSRVDEMAEHNPMLGLRGVRLGVTVPEIYEMQARAIFEAMIALGEDGSDIEPEIMIPLVSAKREVELVKTRIDAVAAAVSNANSATLKYKLGVMVETPRAALRAGDIAQHCQFLSFGTNDLTQMTYGLSRDDAGRFMMQYVHAGVFAEDPFHTLDQEGVGELLEIGAERARAARSGLTLSICGEHGGNTESIAFSRRAGFDYVSCSPYRVPVARLAAAQLAIADAQGKTAKSLDSRYGFA